MTRRRENRVIKELGLENIKAPVIVKSLISQNQIFSVLVLIGFGSRAVSHANGLGFMHPEMLKQ